MILQPRVNTETLSDNLYYKSVLMLDVKIEYPVLVGPVTVNAEQEFNKYYEADLKKLYKYAKTDLFKQAVESYKYTKSNGFPFNHYTLDRALSVTYNENYMISLYFDTYDYTGGAHGFTTRTGNTWSLGESRMLALGDLFPDGYDYKEVIIAEVTRQAEANKEADTILYFDNLEQNILNYFDPANYYLTTDGLAIYYPLYSLTPYSEGIQVFIIPYDQLEMKV